MDTAEVKESLTCASCQSKFRNMVELSKHIGLGLLEGNRCQL